MKLSDAREVLEECRMERGILDDQEIAELLIWAYDKGRAEGVEDLKKESKDYIEKLSREYEIS